MRDYAARLPGLDIFTQKLVVRDARGWQITDCGRTVLDQLEGRCPPRADALATPGPSAPLSDEVCEVIEYRSDLPESLQPRPRLTVIQGGRTKLRRELAAAGKAAVAKGAALRP